MTDELLNESIFDAIEKSGTNPYCQAVAHIEPVGYDDEASSILRCGVDVPLLVLLQHHYSEEGEMVLYSKNYFRADKFSFHVVRNGFKTAQSQLISKNREVTSLSKRKFGLAMSLVLAAGTLLGAMRNSKEKNNEGTGSKEAANKDNFSIAMITDTNGVDDKSFNQAAWKGIEDFAKENNLEKRRWRIRLSRIER